MTSETINSRAAESHPRSRVLTVAVIGPPGAGKTGLLEATARELRGKARVAVVTVNPAADRDAARCARHCVQAEAVKTATPNFREVGPALGRIDWANTDIVLIESLGGIGGAPDLGQDVTVTVLGLSGGDDKAAEYAGLLAASPVLILAKGDLRGHVDFDMKAFRADVRRINPLAEIIEVSSLDNSGIAKWAAWLEGKRRQKDPYYQPAESSPAAAEWYFG
jgi:hydrogenase nickel incorporation protein HypB